MYMCVYVGGGLVCCRKAVGAAVKVGPVPQHVAFIMDGNRRWARRAKEETVTGHSMGFSTLKKVCIMLQPFCLFGGFM